jgi:hypothetical protein
VAVHFTVDPGAGLKDCVFLAVTNAVAVDPHFVVGQFPEVIWLFVIVVDHEPAVSTGVVHVHP